MDLKEYRISRVEKEMKEAGADMIVATLTANLAYLTNGYNCINQAVLQRTECAIAYLPRAKKHIYIVGYAETPSVLEFAGNDAEIYCYSGAFCFEEMDGCTDPFVKRIMELKGQAYGSSAEAWEAAIRANLEPGATIAVDESRVFDSVLEQIKSRIPDYKVIDGTELFMKARLIKHPDEIAGIEASARCAAESLDAALAQYKPGMTEYEIGKLYDLELAKRGAQPYFCTVTSNYRAAFSDTTNNATRPIEKGDMIRFDYGCILNGYCSDLARTAVVGEPSEKIKTYYAAVLAGIDAAIAAAKPGVACKDLFNIAVEETRKNGIPHYRRHHVGHGIGVECYDNPSITPQSPFILEEGMTINLETPYYELGWGGVQIEDTFEVTKDGVRMLDHTTRDLIILNV